MDIRKPDPEVLRRFFWFANERHRIYIKRKAGEPWPWTKDTILRENRFCNVYRELDKVTIWIRKQWREPYAGHKNLDFAMAMARLINHPDTLDEIGFPKRWYKDRVCRILTDRKENGLKTYTSAYMLGRVPPGETKAEFLTHHVLTPLYYNRPHLYPTMSLEEAWDVYRRQMGIGQFIAYEIITDLRHTRYLRNAPDIMTWANAGPGAIRGLFRVYGLPLTGRKKGQGHSISRATALEAMQYLLKLSKRRLGKHMLTWEMREVEHTLCELDKYERARLGEGVLERYVLRHKDIV